MLVARGTKNGFHDRNRLIVTSPVEPGSPAAKRWRPELDEPTYFYEFDIKPGVTEDDIDESDIGGMCEEDLWNAIREAAQPKTQRFVRDHVRSLLGRR